MAKTRTQLEAEIRRVLPRERGGQYAVRNLDRPCACGHRLGEHTSARVAVVRLLQSQRREPNE